MTGRGRRVTRHRPPESAAQTAAIDDAPTAWSAGRRWAAVAAGLAGAIVWLLPAGLLLSASDTDVIAQFVAWRSFAAERILAGDLPFWNPYTYAGQPFVGGFQSAIFYPPNVMFLALPVERAINLSFLLHLVWLGWGMAVWARLRGCTPAGAAVAALVVPLSGPVFPHLYAGHLPNICTMAWAPWLFAGFDRWWMSRDRRGLLVAMAAAAMQALAGHVQYAWYTAMAVVLYAGVLSFVEPARAARALLAIPVIYVGAACLAAAQLASGIAAMTEGLRGSAAAFSYVRAFSFPPENVLTLIAPGVFGAVSTDATTPTYWGRAYLWEMSLFVGAAGVLLATVGIGDRISRRRRCCAYLVIPLVLGVLALGANTPLLAALYAWAPGFATFRGLSKFTFPLVLFGALAIAAGADAVLSGRLPRVAVTTAIGVAGVALAGAGLWLVLTPDAAAGWMRFMQESGESGLPATIAADATFAHDAGRQAGLSLAMAGALTALVSAAFLAARHRPSWRLVPLVVLPLELASFAVGHLGTARLTDCVPLPVRTFLASQPGEYRILNTVLPNNGFLAGRADGGGNDPAVLRRYAELVTASEGGDPLAATQHLPFTRLGSTLAMLRIRYAFFAGDDGIELAENQTPPLPRVFLVSDYRVVPDRRAALATVLAADFDPAGPVILETEPSPRPAAGRPPGSARVTAETSDSIDIEVETPAAAVLVVTDPFSRDWRARPIDSDLQARYEVQPANYVLRGIALTAGRHRLRLEYVPAYSALGAGISILAAAAWLVLWPRDRLGVFTPRRGRRSWLAAWRHRQRQPPIP